MLNVRALKIFDVCKFNSECHLLFLITSRKLLRSTARVIMLMQMQYYGSYGMKKRYGAQKRLYYIIQVNHVSEYVCEIRGCKREFSATGNYGVQHKSVADSATRRHQLNVHFNEDRFSRSFKTII